LCGGGDNIYARVLYYYYYIYVQYTLLYIHIHTYIHIYIGTHYIPIYAYLRTYVVPIPRGRGGTHFQTVAARPSIVWSPPLPPDRRRARVLSSALLIPLSRAFLRDGDTDLICVRLSDMYLCI